MRILGVLCTLALFLFLIAPSRGYAQDENKSNQPQDDQKAKDNDKAKQNEKAKQEDKTARPDEGKRQEQPNAGRQDERQNQPTANRPQEEKSREQQQRDQQQRDQRRDQGQRSTENDRRSGQDVGRDQNRNSGERGRRLPDDQFRAHFGREHRFHVDRQRIVNVSQPVVVYGGYSFQLVDAWPSDWSYDDDCYIDDVNGEYFLFDALHPGIRIAVFLIG